MLSCVVGSGSASLSRPKEETVSVLGIVQPQSCRLSSMKEASWEHPQRRR